MSNITFKKQLTASEELVQGLAIFKGYELVLKRVIEVVDDEATDPVTVHHEEEEYQNPESPQEYVDRLLDDHIKEFYIPFGQKMVEDELAKLGIDEQKAQAKAQIEQAVITPVNDALTGEIIIG